MAGLSFSRAWDETRVILQRDGRLIWPVGLMTLVVPQLLIGTALGPEAMTDMSQQAQRTVTLGLMVVLLLVAWARFAGLTAIAQLTLRSDERVADALRLGLRRGLAVFGATLLVLLPIVVLIAPALLAGTQQPSPAVALLFLTGLVLGLVLTARTQFAIAIAANEGGGSLQLIRRSWALSKGHVLRLLGFMLMFLGVYLIIAYALGAVAGSAVLLTLGKPQPFSVAALLLSLIGMLAQFVVLVPYSVMLARLYGQLAHGLTGRVPHAP